MLEFDALTRRFGSLTALDDVSFSVRPGEICGFVGRNGAGKTTTMRIALGLLEPDAGEVRWRGQVPDAPTRRRFGYMPEERGLYPKMRVGEQLTYMARLHGRDARTASDAAERWMERVGIAERSGDRVEQLSLGNQQRVQLGAALVHDPELLILDEPFSGLDPIGVDALATEIRARADHGVPVLFSSHQLELVERMCQTVSIIDSGRIVAAGPVEELRARAAPRPHVRVAVAGRGPDWLDAVPGGVLRANGVDGIVVELSGGLTPEALLDAARSAGPIERFERVRPTLAELFRETVPG